MLTERRRNSASIFRYSFTMDASCRYRPTSPSVKVFCLPFFSHQTSLHLYQRIMSVGTGFLSFFWRRRICVMYRRFSSISSYFLPSPTDLVFPVVVCGLYRWKEYRLCILVGGSRFSCSGCSYYVVVELCSFF